MTTLPHSLTYTFISRPDAGPKPCNMGKASFPLRSEDESIPPQRPLYIKPGSGHSVAITNSCHCLSCGCDASARTQDDGDNNNTTSNAIDTPPHYHPTPSTRRPSYQSTYDDTQSDRDDFLSDTISSQEGDESHQAPTTWSTSPNAPFLPLERYLYHDSSDALSFLIASGSRDVAARPYSPAYIFPLGNCSPGCCSMVNEAGDPDSMTMSTRSLPPRRPSSSGFELLGGLGAGFVEIGGQAVGGGGWGFVGMGPLRLVAEEVEGEGCGRRCG